MLVLLLGSHVSFAAHQFEHSVDELHETCAVCLVFDRNDEFLAFAEAVPLSPIKVAPVAVETCAADDAQDFCHYRSRASP